ncbi:unnamed protein product, partial [Prorocentrum cordatum]
AGAGHAVRRVGGGSSVYPRLGGAGGIQEQSSRQGQGRRCRGGDGQGLGGPAGQACEGGRQGRGGWSAPPPYAAAPESHWDRRGRMGQDSSVGDAARGCSRRGLARPSLERRDLWCIPHIANACHGSAMPC